MAVGGALRTRNTSSQPMGSGRSTPAPVDDDEDDDVSDNAGEGDVVEEPPSFAGAGSRSDGAGSAIMLT